MNYREEQHWGSKFRAVYFREIYFFFVSHFVFFFVYFGRAIAMNVYFPADIFTVSQCVSAVVISVLFI